MQVIWARRERKYFLMEDWTTQITLMALGFLLSGRMPTGAWFRRSVWCPCASGWAMVSSTDYDKRDKMILIRAFRRLQG
jgi:hypothetical protein